MSWLGGKRIATEVATRLALEPDARVAVGFDAKLAARLAAQGVNVVFVSDVERDVSRATTDAMSLADFEGTSTDLGGAVVVGALARDNRDEVVASFCNAVRDQARVALVDRAQRKVASKVAMVAGLSRLDQTAVGRVVITVGGQTAWRSRASAES